jgi:hypothetical protein
MNVVPVIELVNEMGFVLFSGSVKYCNYLILEL